MKKKILTLLALLMTAVTGAWAQEQSETIVTTNCNIVEGTHFTISNNSYVDGNGMSADMGGITVTPKNGETITKVVISCTYGPSNVNDNNTSVSSGTKEITNDGETITVTDVNASTFTFTFSNADPQFGQFVVYYTAPAGTALTPDATRKVWTLAAMPVSDVELQVEYYPAMLSLGGDATEGGTVEVVGLTGDALPAGFEKDAEGNIYVAQGTTFTVKAVPDEGYHFVCWSDDETKTDPEREITMPADGSDLSLTATFAENEYDITFSEGTNPDPENPEWTATPNPAKTKQTVTVTYSGSKKVFGVKAEKKAPHALATVTTDITVEDGYTVTGTLGANVKISIADGATVTLDGMTIDGENNGSYSWAGITCLGDATIILSGTNTVKGFDLNYPGIYVPEGKTLTIEGSGSLTASSNGWGCGIGGGRNIACGNIVIAGGTVTATGGAGTAGIGSGYDAGCGTISITGGTVNATGGLSAAGIGSGYSGRCGTVTITDGVTSVTATKGDDAEYSIGAGATGSCGTVTIGCSLDSNGNIISDTGSTGPITTNPYTYQPSN